MPHINLLPWREELRKRRQKDFGVLAFLVVLAMIAVVGAVHIQYNKMIDFQQDRNKYLESEIHKLDDKIKQIKDLDDQKRRLIARMEIIQQLQASRPEIVHLFDTIVKSMPDGVYYRKITQKNGVLVLQGVAQSNARVSSLMRNLDASPWLTDPKLLEIKAENIKGAGALRLSAFNLQVQQTNPNKPAEDQAGGGKAKGKAK